MATKRRSRGMGKEGSWPQQQLSSSSPNPSTAASSSSLLAVLLVTSSSRGASIAFRYPRKPKLLRRYSKVRYYGQRVAAEDGRRAAGVGPGEDDFVGADDEEANEEAEGEELLSEDEDDEEDSDDDEEEEEGEEDGDGYNDRGNRSGGVDTDDDGPIETDAASEGEADENGAHPTRQRRKSSTGEERRLSASNTGGPSLVRRALERSRDVNVGLGVAAANLGVGSSASGALAGRGVGESGSDVDEAMSGGGSATGGKEKDRETSADAAQRKARAQKAYQTFLGYDVDFLASVLAPRRELCHQKFELVIDDLAFVGHPVCVDEQGRWDPEAEDNHDLHHEGVRRGRNPKKKPTSASVNDPQDGYIIHDPWEEPTSEATTGAHAAAKSSGFSFSSESSSMTLFHLVLVLDKPDPSPYMPWLDLTSWLQFFYDNIAFKMTAALFAEETRCRFISRESDKLSLLRERCMDDGQSYASFLTHALHVSSLARCLKQMHLSISTSSNAFVTINDSIEAHLQLPPLLQDPSRIAKAADVETQVDLNDPIFLEAANEGRAGGSQQRPSNLGDVMLQEWTRTTGPLLLPWQTLLLLNDRLGKAATHTMGKATTMAARSTSLALEGETAGESSEEESLVSFAGDQSLDAWARKFTRLLRPTLSGVPTFAELAHLLDWDLYEDIYPMVRHLIYYREGRVVDVPRIQNTYSISPLLELEKLPKLSISWSLRFANARSLPPLVTFLANLSSGLRPFHHLMTSRRAEEKALCLDCLVWLLRHEVIVQMHVRLRLVASVEVKRKAAAARAASRKRKSELKEKQRQRDEQRKKRRDARAARKAARAEKRASLLGKTDAATLEAQQNSWSAPAGKTLGEPLGMGMDHENKGRGRSRERSHSPFVEQQPPPSGLTAVMNAAAVSPSSAASQTGKLLPGMNGFGSFGASMGAVSNSDGGHSRNNSSMHFAAPIAVGMITADDELKFERRPVLRSRSPSRLLSMAGSSMGSTTAMQTRASSSRPSTPRGRAINMMHQQHHGHSRASSSTSSGGTAPLLLGPTAAVSSTGPYSGLPQSVPLSSHPTTTTTTADATTGSARTRRGNARRLMSRSPSRARLRVTGFGDEEQIEVEDGDEAEKAAEQYGERLTLDEDARRLSLVGEEEDNSLLGADGRAEEDRSDGVSTEGESGSEGDGDERGEGHEDDDEGESSSASSEAEWWEWDPKASVIGEPSRATREENEWIAVMVQGRDADLAQRFFRLLPYLNGKHTVDEIVYREEMRRRDLRSVLSAFKEEIMTFVHP